MTHGQTLQAAFDSRDLDLLVALFDERIVWLGLQQEYEDDDGPNDHEPDAHDHEHSPMCTNREEVRAVLVRFLASGRTGHPVVLAEAGDSVVVDPRPEPALQFPLHQTFTFRLDRVVLIQDYPDRASALANAAPREAPR
jgi:hypothetical protein